MFLHRFIGSQLRLPSGAFGRIVMTVLLNRGNQELIDSTLSTLDLQPDDRYLDVGFGGGRSLMQAVHAVRSGRMYGVDVSPDVVVAGHRRMRSLVAQGRLDLFTGDVGDLPLRDQLATKVSTINTIYFWPQPAQAMRSLHRVTAPGGRLAIGFTGADKMREYGQVTAKGFTYYTPDGVGALVEDAGFESVHVESLHGQRTSGDYIVCCRRPRA